jgi:hypothetical protein
MPLLGRMQASWILKSLHFNPLCFRNLRCSRQSSPSNDDFVVNFGGDVNTRKDPIE